MKYELGFLGGGNMAEAIIRGAISGQVLSPQSIIVADPVDARRDVLASLGVIVTADNAQVVTHAERIVLAVKPQMLSHLADVLAKTDAAKQSIITIMAGIRIAKIERLTGNFPARICRVMPNTPLMIGQGMSAVCAGPGATRADVDFTVKLFASSGKAVVVDESQMDAVTAVSGSGPAYVFYLAEAMTEAATKFGLPPDIARTLVQQTIGGAAALMRQSEHEPAELRRRVTSPGGTTQAAIEHFDVCNVRTVIVDALGKAEHRSKELGK
ncbi:MAG: pyrroline-5-carboxylate reductase [Phycisphaerales bacterium]